jgi:3-oxoacyl-[acyl-carrier-protein] synthase-1
MSTLTITAAGMVTPVGFNAATSCAALRAGVRNVCKTNLWDKYTGTYLAAGKVPLPQWWVGLGKLADLAAPAILECLAVSRIPPERIPILLGVAPADRPFRLSGLDNELFELIQERLGFPLHPSSAVVPRDHVSAVVGLLVARDLIASGRAPAVIVAAVDSLLQHDLKNHYLDQNRLLTPANSNGFSLGEAGSAVLVTASRDDQPGLRVLSLSLDQEPATVESDLPLRGEGLTRVIRSALSQASLSLQDIHYRITDLNGEHYKFKEIALQGGRFIRRPTAKLFDIWHPIEYIGDVGAAIGPLVFGLALHASEKGYGNGPTVLCTFGNDSGERAGAIVHFVGGN